MTSEQTEQVKDEFQAVTKATNTFNINLDLLHKDSEEIHDKLKKILSLLEAKK